VEVPIHKYFRLFPGNEVRLKNAYFIKCHDFVKDEQGNVIEIHCTYDPETKSGSGFAGRKVKGTIHWIDAGAALPAEFRLFEPLILTAEPEEGKTFMDYLNLNSLEIIQGFVEPGMSGVQPLEKFQFYRHGYFNVDPLYSTKDNPVFNRIVSLKSSFVI